MKKIEKLTPEQEIKLKSFCQEILKFGRSIEPIDHKKCEKIISKFYERIGKKTPTFIYLSSPIMCILAHDVSRNLKNKNQLGDQLRNQLRNQLESQLGNQLGDQLRSQLWSQLRNQLESQLESQLGNQLGDQLRSQLWSQLESQLESQLGNQLRSQLWSQLRSQLWSQLESQLWSQLRSQLWSQLESQLRSQLGNYFAGQQWIHWSSYYKFVSTIGVKYKTSEMELLDEWLEEGKNMHWWFPYEGIVLVSERPMRLTVDKNGRLHNEKEKAIEYSDGWGFYYLNGVCVPEVLVKTPSEQLNIDFFKNEKNADVKAEFVRKFGIERMLDFGTKIDSYDNYDQEEQPWWYKSEYELWDMHKVFPGLTYQPYLKMLNQTTNIWHVEAVSPDCKTLKEAIKERFGGREMKIVGIA